MLDVSGETVFSAVLRTNQLRASISSSASYCDNWTDREPATEHGTFDLAVIDLELPQMNGVELTAAIRGLRTGASLPILVVTGRGGAGDWRLLAQLGASGFLVKPLEAASFVPVPTRIVAQAPASSRGAQVRRGSSAPAGPGPKAYSEYVEAGSEDESRGSAQLGPA